MSLTDMDASNNTGMKKCPSNPNEYIFDLCNRFYALVDHLETMEEKHKVTMDFASCLHKLSLGEVVDIDDGLYDNYVITRMYGTFSYTESSDGSGAVETCIHKAEGIPVLSNSPDADGTVSAPIIDGLLRAVVPPSGVMSSVTNSNGGDESPSSNVMSPVTYSVTNSNGVHGSSLAGLDFLEAYVSANADPSKMNRVKVKYKFDNSKTENETPWIPVLAPFAGVKGHGGITMTLEVGERVLVLLQNKTVKYVVGSLHTKDNIPDLGYKDNVPATYDVGRKIRTIASGNGHAITFKDYSDNSLFFSKIPVFNAVLSSMRLKGKSEGNWMTKVGNIKGGGIVLSDGSCLCTVSLDADKQAININSDFGTVGISAFTGITVNAPNGDITIKGKNVSIEAGNNLSLKAGTNIKKTKHKRTAFGLSFGNALAGFGASALSTLCGVDLSKLFDVSYLRNIYEIFMRPVEGTLSIQSNRNVQITAGQGKVTIPNNLLSTKRRYSKGWINFENKLEDFDKKFRSCINLVDSFCSSVDNRRTSIRSKYLQLMSVFLKLADENHISDHKLTNFDTNYNVELKTICSAVTNDKQAVFNTFVKHRKEFIEEVTKFRDDLTDLKGLNSSLAPFIGTNFNILTYFSNNGNDYYPLTREQITNATNYDNLFNALDKVNAQMFQTDIKYLKRAVVVALICSQNVNVFNSREDHTHTEDKIITLKPFIKPANVGGADQWNDMIDLLDSVEPDNTPAPWGTAFLSGIADTFSFGNYDVATGKWKILPTWQKLLNWEGDAGPRGFESMSSYKGNILLSNIAGNTLSLNEKMAWESYVDGIKVDGLKQTIRNLGLQ